MTDLLPPWANGPFELLVHAEEHLREGGDFDRRIALISFDNAIEVAITTYLTLHPIQRGGRSYPKSDVEKWMDNYHTKLEFLEGEVGARGTDFKVDKAHIIWAHDHRNEQYHGGHKGTPEHNVLKIIREAALWVFETLFDVQTAGDVLEAAMAEKAGSPPPSRNKAYDVAIDSQYGLIEVGEDTYYASEVLFAVDTAAYLDLGGRLCARAEQAVAEEAETAS